MIGFKSAPSVTSFSSRGPSLASPGILKHYIIGPGVNVLAATHISTENKTRTALTFNIVSGTSISCPHLSGIVALLKSAHPDWSPATIKSTIMTTVDQFNLEGQPILDQRDQPVDIFGAGHVNPSKANDPNKEFPFESTIKSEETFPIGRLLVEFLLERNFITLSSDLL
ncbi:hypothetical protein RND71_042830 [Anisodus tanguticus]|uniref:Peptidase S8/S53 domain-containing protein n=1 Tax=Anisodus tanguticus TaxID=243964 RepID=A0AAE1QT24_9SOLA|nr:hypothetical protein RND71_042830 [Anisodus tanguticus]